jgi:hypothetical protein
MALIRNLIDCHEGAIIRVGDIFHWIGRAYHGNDTGVFGTAGAKFRCGLRAYHSTDLVNWHYDGPALEYPADGWLTEGTWHRPRIIYNAATRKFVLWFFLLGIPPGEPAWCKDLVATADRPEGPYTISGQRNASGKKPIDVSGDVATFLDEDGKGYLGNGDWDRNLYVFRLSDDFQHMTGEPAVPLQGSKESQYEGVCLARYKGKYIVAGSGVVGLAPSETSYAVADTPMGPYRAKGLMSENKTWNSQVGSFFYIRESDRLMALCDQWLIAPDGSPVQRSEQSAQLWLPADFDPATETAKLRYVKEWDPFAAKL